MPYTVTALETFCEIPTEFESVAMLADVFEALTRLVEEVVIRFDLPGVTLIAFFENLFPPTPSELLYPLAGKLAYDGKLAAWGIVIAGVIGSLAGSLIYYSLGYWLGEARVRTGIARFGHFALWRFNVNLVAVEDYDRALALFQQYGGVIVLAARIMPLVHGIVSIPAGVTRMKLAPFLLYTTIGSALWIAPLTFLGYFLGSQWERVLHWMDVYENIWYLVMALAVVYWLYRRFRAHRRRSVPENVTAGD
jgi:membrane protein DedA with SNARE-associated domain